MVSRTLPAPKPVAPPMERFAVYEGSVYLEGTRRWEVEAHTHRQAAIKYAERYYATPEELKDELVLVVIRERDGLRCAALLKSKILVQWTAPRVEATSA